MSISDSMISNELTIEIIIFMEQLKVFVIVKIKNMFLLYSFFFYFSVSILGTTFIVINS